MARLERELSSSGKDGDRYVFVDVIRSNPDLTLSEIAKMARGKFGNLLSSVTIGDILGEVNRLRAESGEDSSSDSVASSDRKARKKGASSKVAKASKASAKSKKTEVDTRTKEGRDRYDQSILEVLQASDDPMRAAEVIEQVGGTPLQARKALARLIEAGELSWEGQARATRYFVP